MKLQVIILITALFISPIAQAFTKASKCNKIQLELKDCALETQGYQIHLLNGKINIFDGKWREVEKLPTSGKAVEWQKIKIFKKKKRKFVEILIWDMPSGEANIQSLRWQLLELNGAKYKMVLDKVVRKRTPYLDKDSKKKYHLDKKIPFELVANKGKLLWRVDQQKGVLNGL